MANRYLPRDMERRKQWYRRRREQRGQWTDNDVHDSRSDGSEFTAEQVAFMMAMVRTYRLLGQVFQ